MSIIQIILIAFVHAYAFNGQPSHVLWVPRFTPFAVAPVIGLILGDVKTATIVGAAVQTLNMAPMVVGGFASFDLWMAMTVAIPLVITANVDLETAVAVAAPVSALSGSLVNPLENAIGSGVVRIADKAAENGDAKKIFGVNLWGPMVFKFPIRFIIVVIALAFGVEGIKSFISICPVWLLNAFRAMGSMLPAMGFAIFLAMINDVKLLPYFFMGYYVVYCFGLSTIICAILGACLAVLHTTFTNREVA